jgi:RNA polymerase sigma-70 factor, ECF subfamily
VVESTGAPALAPDSARADEEARWLQLAASGDKASFGLLYDRYAGLLLGIGVRMLRNRSEAEDTLHDVFVEVWRRAGDFDAQRGTARAWVVLRMRSRCLDRLKSPRLARSHPLDDKAQERQEAPAQDPLLRLERERVRTALAALSAEQRNLVELAYFHGLSTSEISEKIGVPQGTVKSRLFAARGHLAALLVSKDAASALAPTGTPAGGQP